MKAIIIFIQLLIVSVTHVKGQVPLSMDQYTLSDKYREEYDTIINKEVIDLNPFDKSTQDQVSITVWGMRQDYRIDIQYLPEDTNVYFTSYIYHTQSSKPKWIERRKFYKSKVKSKKTWEIKMKSTKLNLDDVRGIIEILDSVNFQELPSSREMTRDIGLVQADGYGFSFDIKKDGVSVLYDINRLNLNEHKKLNRLQPIEQLLLSFFEKNELWVECIGVLGYWYQTLSSPSRFFKDRVQKSDDDINLNGE